MPRLNERAACQSQIVYTIGYEGRGVDELAGLLRDRHVAVLVDARYRAQSRKRGFSKTALALVMSEFGIEYQHWRTLGTPPEMMRKRQLVGHYELDEYASHLDDNLGEVARAAEAIAGRVVALLCYERDPDVCHRSVVADRLAAVTNARVEHIV